MTQPSLINIHPNAFSQELYCYPFVVNLDRCVRSSRTINDWYNKVGVQNKTKNLNLSVLCST